MKIHGVLDIDGVDFMFLYFLSLSLLLSSVRSPVLVLTYQMNRNKLVLI